MEDEISLRANFLSYSRRLNFEYEESNKTVTKKLLHILSVTPQFIWKKILNVFLKQLIPKEVEKNENESPTYYVAPLILFLLTLTQVVLYILDKTFKSGSINEVLALNSNHIWTYVTYIFVHGGSTHILVNSIAQIFLGIPLAVVHGWWIITAYFVSVVAAAIASVIDNPTLILIGGSSPVCAFMAIYAIHIIMYWKQINCQVVKFIIVLSLIILTVCNGLSRNADVVDTHITSNIAHISGGVVGVLFGMFILRKKPNQKYFEIFGWICLVFCFLMMILATKYIFIIPSSHFFKM